LDQLEIVRIGGSSSPNRSDGKNLRLSHGPNENIRFPAFGKASRGNSRLQARPQCAARLAAQRRHDQIGSTGRDAAEPPDRKAVNCPPQARW
jgi:hypothetical protein